MSDDQPQQNPAGEDGKQAEGGSEHLNLKVKSQDGNEVYFKVKKTTQFSKVMSAYCKQPQPRRARVQHRTRLLDVLCLGHPACQARIKACADGQVAPAHSATTPAATVPEREPYVLLLLNQPPGAFFRPLWENASFRICADGGANRLFDAYASDEERRRHLPNFIIGDLDSLRPEVFHFFTNDAVACRSVLVRRDHDEENTDLDKCLEGLRRMEREAKRVGRRDNPSQIANDAAATKECDAQAQGGKAAAAATPAFPASSDLSPSAPSECAFPASSTPATSGVKQWGPAVCTCGASSSSVTAPSTCCDCISSSSSLSFFSSPSTPALSNLPVLLYPAFGGRFDHQTAVLNTLCRNADAMPHAAMIAEGNLARVLLPYTTTHTPLEIDEGVAKTHVAAMTDTNGVSSSSDATHLSAAAAASSLSPSIPLSHILSIHPCLELGHHCGLFPLGAPASRVTTQGLAWNLSEQPMEWGKAISSSNRVQSSEVQITSDAPLVWTCELQHHHVLQGDGQRGREHNTSAPVL